MRSRSEHAERLGVAERARAERAPARRLDRRRRRAHRRLADFHVDDVAAGGFDPRGRRHHVHHHERRNIAARGGRNEAARVRASRRELHRFAPLLPHSNACLPRLSAGNKT
jgi:hypothetical protein